MRAWHLKQLSWKQRQIAVALGVREGTVSRWIARARRDGPAALLSHLAHGHPAKLRPDQRRRSSRKSSASPLTRATSLGS